MMVVWELLREEAQIDSVLLLVGNRTELEFAGLAARCKI
jgi:hypothetical protein